MQTWQLMVLGALLFSVVSGCASMPRNARPPADDAALRYWLENMIWYHQFTSGETSAATGLTESEIAAAMKRFDIWPRTRPDRPADAPLLVLPYPGGRHPRIGFLDGAIEPQRETKISVFAPWDHNDYLVIDVPEAIWSNLGLTYLAHTHIATIWTEQGVELPVLEWTRHPDGTLAFERVLPNDIAFGSQVLPCGDMVRTKMWLRNGTDQTLTGLRIQMCTMFPRMKGFAEMTDERVVHAKPFVAYRSADRPDRWVITAWEPCWRPWHNPPVPCIHSDPQLPDCPPGETVRARGFLAFYEGPDVQAEFRRLDTSGWR